MFVLFSYDNITHELFFSGMLSEQTDKHSLLSLFCYPHFYRTYAQHHFSLVFNFQVQPKLKTLASYSPNFHFQNLGIIVALSPTSTWYNSSSLVWFWKGLWFDITPLLNSFLEGSSIWAQPRRSHTWVLLHKSQP